jgi:hypothetical protein
MVDPERPGKKHLGPVATIAVIVLLLAVAFAPWAVPSLPYR